MIKPFWPFKFFLICFLLGNALIGDVKSEVSDSLAKNKEYKDPVDEARALINRRDFDTAEKKLLDLISKIPDSWKPIVEDSDSIKGSFWCQDEFISYANYQNSRGNRKSGYWINEPSYSRASFELGYIAIERRNYPAALYYFEQGLALEPDHPDFYNEIGYVLLEMGRYQEAYEAYDKALKVRPWMTSNQKAVALRGAGSALKELGRYDEALEMFKKSLEIEPNNEDAQWRVKYIQDLKEKLDNMKWFLLEH